MELLNKIALTMTPGLGPSAVRRLCESFPGEDVFALPPSKLRSVFANHPDTLHHILHKTAFPRAEAELRFAEQHGISPLFFSDPAFPQHLNRPETSDCPALLYVLGKADLNPERSIAIVGTRRATPQGRDTTDRLVAQLVPYSTPVVSGLAYGIDTAAHSAALAHHLPTVAVLGHGLDRIYPAPNRRLASDIVAAGGALVSEYPSQTPINPRNFPARNRIIAALADAVVVVEATAKGGALITAGIATGYHRDVFAIPGRLSDTYSVGTNNLIATNKALLIRSADDIAYNLGWPLAAAPDSPHLQQQQQLFQSLPPAAQSVLDILHEQNPLSIDQLASLSNLPMPKLAALLFDLEMAKAVYCLPGRLYQAAQ